MRKARMLIAGAGITEGSNILELGCGVGTFTRELARTGAGITAIDLSPNMIQRAKENPLPNVFYMIDDAHKTVFRDARFDAVVGFYILQYLNLAEVLPEIMRILKPGGRVAFIDINTLNPLAFVKTKLPFVKRPLNISREAVSFTPWGLADWFERYRFDNVEVTTFEFGAGPLNILENMPFIRHFAGNLLVIARKCFG